MAASENAPLQGMRIVDLADELGELCGRVPADLGAEVTPAQPPAGPASRALEPMTPDGRTSLYFGFRNAGKRSVVADLSSAVGRARLHELLGEADVLIESGGAGWLAANGLDPTELMERYPTLIVTSISDFGLEGPYAHYKGTDMIGFAMGGLMYRAGVFEKPPLVAPGNLAYDVAGMVAAMGTLIAFFKRMRTGRGQHLDVSTMEAVANLADWSLPNYSLNPQVGPRAGAGIYTLYKCADGYMRMIILVTKHWRTLLDWVGNPPELADPDLDQFINRLMRLGEIVPVLERFFADKEKIWVSREAQARGIPSTPLLEPGEVLDNEHTVARASFCDRTMGEGVEARIPSGFMTLDGERLGPERGAPLLGELADGGFASPRGPLEARLEQPTGDPDGGHPFSGLRVIDFGVGAVGVEVARILGEYGAEVIKVETASAPDFIRVILSSYMNPSFASSSRTKKSFGVDLKTEEGKALVTRLLESADVCIENNGTGVMDRLGLGADDLRRINPRLVSFSSQMVGSFGPWKDWTGYGPNTHPVSGLQYLWNYPEDADKPAGSTNVYPDHFVGRIGVFAVVAGLIRREISGEGGHYDVAQFEAALGLLGDLYAKESLEPGSVRPQGNANHRGAPWGCYRCEGEDEWIVVNVRDEEEWQALCGVIGAGEWADDASLASAAARRSKADQIDARIEAWTSAQDSRVAMETLQEAGVPAGIVAHAGHHMSDPQMTFRNYPKFCDQQGLGGMLLEGPAFLGSDLPEVIITQAPWLGEHTRELARELLGLGDQQIEDLIARGILEDPPGEYQVPG